MSSSRRIPLEKLIRKSYHFSFYNFLYFLQISWVGLVIIILNNALFLGLNNIVAFVIFTTINIFAVASISIAWHKKIIANETVTSSFYLRTDALALNYFGFAFVLALPSLILMVIFTFVLERTSVTAGLYLVLALLIYIIVMRLSLGLPGKAFGWPGFPFAHIWSKTAHNTLAILAGYIACTLPVVFGAAAISVLSFGILAIPASVIGAVFITANSLSFMTFAFEYLFEPKQNQTVSENV
ncbi:MAG: hypothetical protein AAF228_00655 [Pseudomonadota bacterium]